MKKLCLTLLAVLLLACLCGCKTNNNSNNDNSKEEGGQNPVMNFIGTYGKDRATITIDAEGSKDAKATVVWGSSAAEVGEWTMSGEFNSDTLTFEYDNCVKKSIVYNEDGSVKSETEIYNDGKGSMTFAENPLSLTWDDQKEHIADGTVFEYSPVN